MKTIVMIPTYNEAGNIESLISRLLDLGLDSCEILVVDDNSPDGTSNIVREYEKKYNNIKLIFREGKNGLGAAYIHGIQKAITNGFDFVIMMDSDLSHNPTYLPNFIENIEKYDFIIGSRYIKNGGIKNWGIHRRLMSFTANLLIKIMLRTKVKDNTSGYRAIRISALKDIKYSTIQSQGYAFLYEMLWRIKKAKHSVKEIPIVFIDRQYGITKISKNEISKAFKLLFKLMFKKNY